MNLTEVPIISEPTPCHQATGRHLLAPAVGRLHGFDLLDQPLVTGLGSCPAEVLTACSTLPLRRAMVGRHVVVLFEGGDPRLPIIMGVIEEKALVERACRPGCCCNRANNDCHDTSLTTNLPERE